MIPRTTPRESDIGNPLRQTTHPTSRDPFHPHGVVTFDSTPADGPPSAASSAEPDAGHAAQHPSTLDELDALDWLQFWLPRSEWHSRARASHH